MAQTITVIMAVFHPKRAHLAAQIVSIVGQSHPDVTVLFVAADTVSGALIDDLARGFGLSYETVTPAAPMDAVRAFEYGLATALEHSPDTAFFALSDQDDIWHPDRLAHGLRALCAAGADLAHSDARVVDDRGKVLHRSLFGLENRQTRAGLRGLLYRNNVTGMTTLMTRRLVENALPFPPQDGVHFYHDLWLALVGSVLSDPVFVKAPLVDYRQHEANAVGVIAPRNTRDPGGVRSRLRRYAAGYALAMYLARSLVLRFGQDPAHLGRLAPLRPFLARLSMGPRFVVDAIWLAVTGKRDQARIALTCALVAAGRSVWALKRALGIGLDVALSRFDQRAYALSPGQVPQAPARLPAQVPETVAPEPWIGRIERRTMPLWQPIFTADRPAHVILLPTLNPTEIFAGIVTALDFGLHLARQGIAVRLVATDLPIASAAASRAFIMQRLPAGKDPVAPISLHCGVTQPQLPCHPGDTFLATAWWTAHVAQSLVTSGKFAQRRFYYLIQDFEPNFYPWGSEYSGALESYGFDFEPIFNSTPLRRFFERQGFAFATPDAMTFRPSIDIARYAALPSRRGKRKLVAVYGRPEVPRNMFPLAIDALGGFLATTKPDLDEVSLVSVGLKHADILMPGGHLLKSLGKLPWADYPDFLSTVDMGLSLMLSPHPSHPPLEMAAAGVNVVTNDFDCKDLSRLTPAILSCAPTSTALTDGLQRAWAAPPPNRAARKFDMTPLGGTLGDTAKKLGARILADQPADRLCA